MSDLYFNEESYYSKENTCDNKVFHNNNDNKGFTIL